MCVGIFSSCWQGVEDQSLNGCQSKWSSGSVWQPSCWSGYSHLSNALSLVQTYLTHWAWMHILFRHCAPHTIDCQVSLLEFNVPFQHRYGYIRHERSGVESYPYQRWIVRTRQCGDTGYAMYVSVLKYELTRMSYLNNTRRVWYLARRISLAWTIPTQFYFVPLSLTSAKSNEFKTVLLK